MAKRKKKNIVRVIWYADKAVIEALDQMADRANSDRGKVLSLLIMSELEARAFLASAPKTGAEFLTETLQIRRSKTKGENNG